jgi:hypothetical protein
MTAESEGKNILVERQKVKNFSAFFLLLLMLISLSALSYVPSLLQVSTLFFIFLYGLFFVFAVAVCDWRSISLKWLLLVGGALFALIINFFVSILGDVSIGRWVRSFVPMLFFVTVFSCSIYIRLIGCERVLKLLLASCFSYCFFLLVFNFGAFLNFISLGGRLTFYLQDSVVPYPYVGLILAVLLPGVFFPLRVFLLFVFAFFILVVGYKAQIIFLLFFGLFFALFISRGFKRVLYIVLLVLFSLLIFFFMTDYLIQRFSSIGGGGDEVRMLEIRYAWEVFLSSPVWGGGLGTEVPLSLTRPDYEELHHLWGSDTVSYIHNFPMYLLMVGGGVFFLLFVLLLQLGGFFSISNLWSRNKCLIAAMWCAFALMFFFLTSAAFKQVQSVILLSLFIAVLSASRKTSI